jgi:hypothetical protein
MFPVPSWLFVAELGICVYVAGDSTLIDEELVFPM